MELKRLWNGIKIINKIWTRATTYLKKQNSINAINKYMATKKKKILITGASGFIGRNIFEKLSQREDLDVWGTYLTDESFKDGPKMLRADLTQKSEVYKIMQGVDVLIQGAATTSGAKDTFNKPYYHVTDNAIVNALLYHAAHECNVSQAIFFSCTTIYPNLDRPVVESDVDLVGGIYDKYFGVGWTKIYIEKLCEFYSRLGKTKFTVIRHSNIYGPYDKYDLEKSHVFGATITKVMTAKDGDKIVVWGAGNEERDLLYVSDIVDFVKLAIEKQKDKFQLFNAGYGSSISVKELVEKIVKHSGKNLKSEHDLSKPSIKTKICLDSTKAKEIFGWAPKTTLDEGIKKTIEWYKEYYKV